MSDEAVDPRKRQDVVRTKSKFGGQNVHCSSCGVWLGWAPNKVSGRLYCRIECSLSPPLTTMEVRDSILMSLMGAMGVTYQYIGDLMGVSRSAVLPIFQRRITKNPKTRR